MEPKLFMLGLDGATFDLITPWVKAGHLPNFKSLMEEGVSGYLRSTVQPLSPPAWTSFMTGKNPGKHGIFDFVIHRPGSYELVYTNGGLRHGKTLWALLGGVGKRVVVMDVPMTYPPEAVNGVMISGFDSPGLDSQFTYPPDLYEEIKRNTGEYVLRDYPHHTNPASYLEQLYNLIDVRRRVIHYLMDKKKWDFFMVVLCATDLVQHFYWQYMDTSFKGITDEERNQYGDSIFKIYKQIDIVLGELQERIPEDVNFIVMSDHGAGPTDRLVYMDQWLVREKFLAYNESNLAASIPLRILKALHLGIKRRLSPQKIEWLVRNFPQLRQRVKTHLDFSEIDWNRTKAYSFGRESASIYINLKGRCPQGIVEPGTEYEAVCQELTERLEKLKDPDTGRQVVGRVYRKEEVFEGKFLEQAPDLLVIWKDYRYTCRPGYRDRNGLVFGSSLLHSEASEVSTLKKGGTHREMGVFLAKGPSIVKGENIQGARLIDLLPTVLKLFDIPIPDDTDGRVLEEIFIQQLRDRKTLYTNAKQTTEPIAETIYSETQSAEIAERLKKLGYF